MTRREHGWRRGEGSLESADVKAASHELMRYRILAVFPLLWGAVFLLGYGLLEDRPGLSGFVRTEIELVKVLGLFGCWSAALAFERADYLRRAWLLVGCLFAFLLPRDLIALVPGPFETVLGARGLTLARAMLVVTANVLFATGNWMLARTWKVAALHLPGSSRNRWLVRAGVVVLVVAFAGPGVWGSLERMMHGDSDAIAGLASSLGDGLALCFIGPLCLTALALRGGAMSWPWALLTLSNVAWLFYDAAAVGGPLLGLGPSTVRLWTELFRALACTLAFSAGMAQRAVLSRLRELAAPPAAVP
jgi:hypothetical protein